jgi:hypothetical protein
MLEADLLAILNFQLDALLSILITGRKTGAAVTFLVHSQSGICLGTMKIKTILL